VLMSTMRNTTTGRSKGFCSGGQRCTVCRGIRHAERRLLLLIDLGFFPLYHAFILEDLQQFLVSYKVLSQMLHCWLSNHQSVISLFFGC
jgi:hypothetical protein